MKTEKHHNSDEWRWSIQFSLPKWLPVLFWYLCTFSFGCLMGWFVHGGQIIANENAAYQAGYEDGKTSCSAPTRLEKGAKAFTGWLSDRD